MNYIVYKTTNVVNGKIYVGVHKTANPDVFDGYIGCGIYREVINPKTHFQQAVLKYGYKNFKRETLFVYEGTPEGEIKAYRKEMEIVTQEFIDQEDTYNMVLGGKIEGLESRKTKIAQYTLDGKFVRSWDSITQASEELHLKAISQCVTGISKYCGEFLWRYYTNEDDIEAVQIKEKTVYLFDLQGNLIKVWKSAIEASQIFDNRNAARSSITQVCNKVRNQAYGYYWSFKNKFELPFNKAYQAVAKYTDSGEFIKSYTSLKEAAADHGLKSTSSITHAIKGLQKRAAGFRWRYFYGNTSNIESL